MDCKKRAAHLSLFWLQSRRPELRQPRSFPFRGRDLRAPQFPAERPWFRSNPNRRGQLLASCVKNVRARGDDSAYSPLNCYSPERKATVGVTLLYGTAI